MVRYDSAFRRSEDEIGKILMPAALSHGIGSESQRPLAIVIIGGLIGATFFTLFVFPLIVEAFYQCMLYDKGGKILQRRL